MTTMIIKVNVSQLDAEDQRAIRFICDQENERRRVAGVEPLPFDTATLRREFYEEHLAKFVVGTHANYVDRAAKAMESEKPFKDLRSAWSEATPEQREAALKALTPTVPG